MMTRLAMDHLEPGDDERRTRRDGWFVIASIGIRARPTRFAGMTRACIP